MSIRARQSAASRLDAPPHPSRRKYALLFVALLTLAVGAVVVAARSDPSKVAAPLDVHGTIGYVFRSQYWAAHYTADVPGHRRASTVGYVSDTETENVLRSLLGVRASAPRAGAVNEGRIGTPPTATDDITPETYLGLQRGIAGARPGAVDYPPTATLGRDQPQLVGRWFGDDEDVVSSASGAAIVIRYRAR